MLKLFIAALFLLPTSATADGWSHADTKREAIYLTFHTLDWAQTRNIARNPDKWFEYNPIIGKHPHIDKVVTYFLLTGMAHVGLAYIIPLKYRSPFQYISIGVEGGQVLRNYQIGVKLKF